MQQEILTLQTNSLSIERYAKACDIIFAGFRNMNSVVYREWLNNFSFKLMQYNTIKYARRTITLEDSINRQMEMDFIESAQDVYRLHKKLGIANMQVSSDIQIVNCKRGRRIKSEADFIVCSPEYGFLCLEVKGGSQIRKENDTWYLNDITYGERKLNESPYDQAEKSMYYFESVFSNMYNLRYPGIFGAGVVFPFYAIPEELNLDNRQRSCTIDCYDLNHLADRIKKMFKLWGGSTYGLRIYSLEQHRALVELIRDRIAISAAAGALIRYKEQQS